jgi:mycofactocin biosynthetic radical S-adenosylmethionine protein MftC
MGFERVVLKTWRENRLFSVLLELTYRCNLDCFFCYNDVTLAGEPLSSEEWFRLLEDLAGLGVLHLTLSGGEPLAHPDFFRIGGRARDLGFVVRVKSNGHALRGALARRLRDEVDPFLVETSLHGATAATHDRQTRVPGSFERLVANVREMREIGLRVKVNSTLTAWNEGEIEGMLDLCEELGVAFQIDPEVTPRDDGSREPLSISPSREGIERLFATLTERAERTERAEAPKPAPVIAREGDDLPVSAAPQKHCGAGSSSIAVDPYGNVYPCVQWRRPVGNLHGSSIVEIWNRSQGLDEIRRLTVAAKGVVDAYGADGPLLNFCPGNAESLTGNPLQVYEGAERRMDLARQIRQAEEGRRALLPVVS